MKEIKRRKASGKLAGFCSCNCKCRGEESYNDTAHWGRSSSSDDKPCVCACGYGDKGDTLSVARQLVS